MVSSADSCGQPDVSSPGIWGQESTSSAIPSPSESLLTSVSRTSSHAPSIRPNSKDFFLIKRVHLELISTESILLHPLDTNS